MPTEQTISARWVAPVCTSPVADGIVSFVDGLITFVGENDGRPVDHRFDDAILVPGLVNAHTHLDLTGAIDRTPPQSDFCSWLHAVISYRQSRLPSEVRFDVRAGVAQCLAAGTTLVGDIAIAPYDYGPLQAVAFQELIGLSEDRCAAALASWRAAGFISAGVSPHAPYSFRFTGLDKLPHDKPLAIHMAETPEELTLLDSHDGRFRRFLENINAWDDTGLAPSIAAIMTKLSQRRGPVLLIHCNYLPPDVPMPADATVVYCPRTHAAFGHPPHPFREFLARGIRVVLGTDSMASNPDLSVLNEARFIYPNYDNVESLLAMITSQAAEALGLGNSAGRLVVGSRADMCVVGVPTNSRKPLHDLFDSDRPVQASFVNGQRVGELDVSATGEVGC